MTFVQDRESLVTRMLKSKYFSHKTLFDASLGFNPLFIWRSLASAIDLIKEGACWRIETGHNIRIWHDKWLPSPMNHVLLYSNNLLSSNAKVSDLIL